MINRRGFLRAIVAGGASASVARPAAAQSYPSRPIRIIVPLPPGATADTLPRLIGEKLTAKWRFAKNPMTAGTFAPTTAALDENSKLLQCVKPLRL